MITNALSQRSQLKVDNDSLLSITQDDTSFLKGDRYSSVLNDFSNTAAFSEQTLPRSRKSCEVLSSDGQIQNAKASRKQVPPTTGEYQHVRGIYKDDATISGLRTEDEYLKDLYVQKHCKEMIKSPNVFLANSKTTYANNTRRLKRVEVGEKKLNGKHEKVILMVGATGAGKTRLINALFNQIVGGKWNDKVKLCLVRESGSEEPANKANSQTDWVTAYTIHHDDCFTIPYIITVIDTPGFGDTRGILKDSDIPKQLHEFFSTNGNNGIDQLDAVGFVTQSSLPRLTTMQTYIFDSILRLFGKDIEDNIFLMFTFADGPKPQAMS